VSPRTDVSEPDPGLPRTDLLPNRLIPRADRAALQRQSDEDTRWLRRRGRRWRLRPATPAEVRTILRGRYLEEGREPLLDRIEAAIPLAAELGLQVLVVECPSRQWRVTLAWRSDAPAETDDDLAPRLRRALAERTDARFREALSQVGNPSAVGAADEPAPTDEEITRVDSAPKTRVTIRRGAAWLPRAIQEAEGRVIAEDRAWFRQHPGRRWRVRAVSRAERSADAYADLAGREPIADDRDWMLVINSSTGQARARLAFDGDPAEPPWDEHAAALRDAPSDRAFVRLLLGVEPPDRFFDEAGQFRSAQP
jgi:hypothetical protein